MMWLAQYAGFNLGDAISCMSKPNTVEASKTKQDIYEMRLDKVPSTLAIVIPCIGFAQCLYDFLCGR